MVKKLNLTTTLLQESITLTNADGTPNQSGKATTMVKCQLQIGQHIDNTTFIVADIGHHEAMIGFTYLKKHNPEIDWTNGIWKFTRCPESCKSHSVNRQNISSSHITTLDVKEKDALNIGFRINLVTPVSEIESCCIKNTLIQWMDCNDPILDNIATIISCLTNNT